VLTPVNVNHYGVSFQKQRFALLLVGRVLDTCFMRWRMGPIRKRHVPEPEKLRQLAAELKGQADRLSRQADALIEEAEALEGARQPVQSKSRPRRQNV
jgi:hypothetical protein